MGGGKSSSSGSSGGSSASTNPYSAMQAQIAYDMYTDTAGLRNSLLNQYGQVFGWIPDSTSTTSTGSSYSYTPTTSTYYNTGTGTTSDGSTDLYSFGVGYNPDGSTYPLALGSSSATTTGYTPTSTTTGTGTTGTTSGTITPSYDVSSLPTYKPLFGIQKQSLEGQYQQAKKELMESTPSTGGNLTGALTELAGSRAASMGAYPAQLGADILSDMTKLAYGAAFQTPSTALSGLSGASSAYATESAAETSAAATEDASTNSLWGGIGAGLGKIASSAIKKS